MKCFFFLLKLKLNEFFFLNSITYFFFFFLSVSSLVVVSYQFFPSLYAPYFPLCNLHCPIKPPKEIFLKNVYSSKNIFSKNVFPQTLCWKSPAHI